MNTTDVNIGIREAGRVKTDNPGQIVTTKAHGTLKSTMTLLRFTYGIVPIVAGADKFINFLTNWENYLSPFVLSVLPLPARTFMMIVGVIEMIAGMLVLARPRIGGYIVAAWLSLISLSLLFSWNYPDVAVRDLVMAIGAFTLARLSR